jgi:hypothetical protein
MLLMAAARLAAARLAWLLMAGGLAWLLMAARSLGLARLAWLLHVLRLLAGCCMPRWLLAGWLLLADGWLLDGQGDGLLLAAVCVLKKPSNRRLYAIVMATALC